MENQVERYAGQAFAAQVWEETVHSQAAAYRHAQCGLLSAIPLHLQAARVQGDAKHQQQDRRHIHRSEEEPEQSQRDDKGEPQAVH